MVPPSEPYEMTPPQYSQRPAASGTVVAMQCSSLSEEMKKLRKEISLCESIAERSEIISPKLQQIYAEETGQQKQRKEKAYEPWR